ncbi:oxalyl-CoA decarboxylase [soil metagenome]
MSGKRIQTSVSELTKRVAGLSPEKRLLLQQQLAGSSRSGFELIARSLREFGITHIYVVAGMPSEELLPACVDQNIRPIGVYHQTSAICMALAHNYQCGRLAAAALVSAGPAASNSITGLLVAHDNGWPVIVLGGRSSSFQKFDVLPIVSQITKYAVQVPSTVSIGACIREAHEAAVSGRPGPVYMDLHEDVLRGRAVVEADSSTGSRKRLRPAPSASDEEIETVAAALLSARCPALLLGKGVRWTVVPEQLQALVEAIGLPLITSPMGRGFIPEDHPLCFNQARVALKSRADVVLMLGARLNWVFRHGVELSREACVFRVDIHHDDDDDAAIETRFIHADAGDFVNRLIELVKHRHKDVSNSRCRRLIDWQNSLRAVSDETQRLLDQRMSCNTRPMSPYRMMKEIRNALPRDAICITEGNVSMRAAQAAIPAFCPASRMDAGTNGCMGVGIPFAIGAKLACPDRPVVAVVGDYGFSLSAMEMEVCPRQGIPVIVVIANNQGNNGALKQRAYFPDQSELVTSFQPGLEYERIMQTFGGDGTTVTDPDLLGPMLVKAIASDKPTCINVIVDPHFPLPNAWGEQSSIVPFRA